ncbi:MAG: zinc metallopeptidase, partial [Synergistaceae bacterium]|nr:zinc metallopeptidase [Synergistaceae bacterium]
MYPMGFGFDSTMLILIPAVLLSLWAQSRVSSTFAQYSGVYAHGGVTADQVARMLLTRFGLGSMPINRVAGSLTDNYNPADRTLNLSESVYNSRSIASIGVAAHEVGHAIQHSKLYAPLMFRNSIVPVVNITTQASMPLFFIGLIMGNSMLLNLGIILFCGSLVFHLVTLPVELDASSRALKLLKETGTLTSDELAGARKVLNAAALTYVAAALMSILQLVRLIMIKNSRE